MFVHREMPSEPELREFAAVAGLRMPNRASWNSALRKVEAMKNAPSHRRARTIGAVFLGWYGWALLGCLLSAALLPVFAGGTLTNCTYESLSAALIGGGLVRFECDGTITLPDKLTINLTTVIDAVGHSVTLAGGTTNKPIFLVQTNVDLTLRSLTLSGAKNAKGGAIYSGGRVTLMNCTLSDNTATEGFGGAVFNASGATLFASGCSFTQNSATGTAGDDGAAGGEDYGMGKPGQNGGAGQPAYGGAIYNASPGANQVTLTNCVFSANAATGGNGGKGGDGGDGTFQGGNGGRGGAPGLAFGGAVHSEGTLDVRDCSFSENTSTGGAGGAGGAAGSGIWSAAQGSGAAGANAAGGAVYSAGTVVLMRSTFDENTVTGGAGEAGGVESGGEGLNGAVGGAARGGACGSVGTATAVNCTFYANVVTGGAAGAGGPGGMIGGDGGNGGSAWGGGIYSAGPASLTNCTLAANEVVGGAKGAAGEGFSSGEDGKAGSVRGANVAAETNPLLLRNSLLAGAAGLSNAYGTIVDGGHNLSSDATPPFAVGAQSTNNVDPQLDDFGAYGGLTDTLPLKRSSPALNQAAREISVPTDQRGVARTNAFNPLPDIGAFELQPVLISGRVSTLQPEIDIAVQLIAPTSTQTNLTSNGSFSFVSTEVGAQRVELAAPDNAASLPAQYYLYIPEFSEGVSNLIFYPRQSELAFGTPAATNQRRLLGVGLPSTTYYIQATAALANTAAVWQSLATNKSDANGAFEFVQTNATQFLQRFYRAVQP
jgi:hypothetical protein